MRESDTTCLVVPAAMHSGRGHFLYAMTPATPALLTWFGLPAPGKIEFTIGTSPLRGNMGVEGVLGGFWGGGGEWAKLWRILCLSLYVRLCETGCVCKQQLCRGVLTEFSRDREKKESFSKDKILGSLEAQGTAGALFPSLRPHSLLLSLFFF